MVLGPTVPVATHSRKTTAYATPTADPHQIERAEIELCHAGGYKTILRIGSFITLPDMS